MKAESIDNGVHGMKTCLAAVALSASLAACGGGYSNGAIEHVKPMNLFPSGGEVSFAVKPGKDAEKGFVVTDYYGNVVPATYDREGGRLMLGKLAPGYYAIDNGGKVTSFGVVSFADRSAEEFRSEGRRFGLKVFMLSDPGVWWRRPWTWELDECVTACEKMGLQWTRHSFNGRGPKENEPGMLSTLQIVNDHRMNCVMKIEGIPESAYDENRYGPMEKFKERKNKRGWQRCSVPVKDPYQRWLAEGVSKLPKDQNVFEMGNEVWDYMTAKEFAEWCRMSVPVLRKIRPGCSIGADPGRLSWGTEFAKAGGFEGMDAMYIHPYSFTPAPEVRIRAWIRNRREYCEKLAGRKLDVYVTEYGWPTAPKDKRGHSCSERQQAQRTTRESLMLYAEGCKTLIPHWMADREQDPSEREHWFGLFRLCGEPKPVVVAHAACARMIDGSEFVGDLVIPGAETGVGSMLFRRAKSWVLAVWTQDESVGAGRDVTVPVVPDAVFGMMGDARKVDAKGGAVTIRASADVMYLVGKGSVPASLLRLVDKSGELSETRWNNRIDGNEPKFTVGRDPNPVSLSYGPAGERPSVSAWHDAEALRFRVDLPAVCAVGGKGKLFLYFSTRPERQPQIGDWAYFDYELKASLKDGAFTLTLGNPTFPKDVLNLAADAPTEGIVWSCDEKDGSRRLDVSIPVKLLNGFGANKKGLMSGQASWATEGKSWKLNSKTPEQNWQWPLWKLDK